MGDVEALHACGWSFEIKTGTKVLKCVFGCGPYRNRSGELPGALECGTHGSDEIAQLSRLFEGVFLGVREHLPFHLADPLPGSPFKEVAGLGNPFAIGLDGDFVFVSVDFAADVIVEAPDSRGDFPWAGIPEQDTEVPPHLIEGLAEQHRMHEGSVVGRFGVDPVTGEAKGGEGLVTVEAHEQEAFVVDEVGVVFRFPFLDELALKNQGFGVGFDLDDVEIGDQRQHGFDFGLLHREFSRRLEVGAHPFLEVLGFSHVDDLAETVFHQVDAGHMRQGPDLFL